MPVEARSALGPVSVVLRLREPWSDACRHCFCLIANGRSDIYTSPKMLPHYKTLASLDKLRSQRLSYLRTHCKLEGNDSFIHVVYLYRHLQLRFGSFRYLPAYKRSASICDNAYSLHIPFIADKTSTWWIWSS